METAACLWFSKHDPSADQIEELKTKRLQVVGVEAGKSLWAKISIGTVDDSQEMVNELLLWCRYYDVVAIAGSFPAPLQELILMSSLTWWDDLERCYTCYSAWNVEREPAVFEHYRFFLVGYLYPVVPYANNNYELITNQTFTTCSDVGFYAEAAAAGKVTYHG